MDNKYCTHATSLGQRFSDGTILTTVTIPPSCVNQDGKLLIEITKMVFKHGGKIWEAPAISQNGSLVLSPITFFQNEEREKCCSEIDKMIDKHQIISVQKIEGEEEAMQVRVNLKFLFVKFHEILQEIKPATDFIDQNGGWFDPKTGAFPGFDALDDYRHNDSVDSKKAKEIDDAIKVFGKFMMAFIIGYQSLGDDEVSIVPH